MENNLYVVCLSYLKMEFTEHQIRQYVLLYLKRKCELIPLTTTFYQADEPNFPLQVNDSNTIYYGSLTCTETTTEANKVTLTGNVRLNNLSGFNVEIYRRELNTYIAYCLVMPMTFFRYILLSSSPTLIHVTFSGYRIILI